MEDVEIARNTKLERIEKIAEKIGIKDEELEQYGKYKAKINRPIPTIETMAARMYFILFFIYSSPVYYCKNIKLW